MAFLMDHRHSSSGSDQSYHSATAEEDNWVHSKNIGAGGFGVVKLFVNQVCVVYAQLCHYDVIAFVSVLRMCSLVLVSLVYEKWSQ